MLSRKLSLVGLVAAVALSGIAAADPVVPSIRTTQTSGVAPLAVVFDAVTTVDAEFARPFHTLDYRWDFGDPSSGVWSLSQKSKNEAIGPVAGHLFARPGTYRVALTVTNPRGRSTTSVRDITVSDPNVVFAGAATTCVSSSGNFGGCPAGALRVTSSSFSSSLVAAPGNRTLYRRGETFSVGSTVGLPDASGSAGSIGAFPDTGARPIITTNTGLIGPDSDWRISDLDVRGSATSFGMTATGSSSVHRFTVNNTSFTGFDQCMTFSNGSSPVAHSGLAFVDFRCVTVGDGGRSIFGRSRQSMYMGIDLDASGGSNTGFRTVYADTWVIQHSRLRSGSGGSVLSIRSCGGDNHTSCVDGRMPNQYIIVSDNQTIDASGSAPIRTCTHSECDPPPADRGNDSKDIIWERNFFTYNFSGGAPSNKYLWLQGGEQTVRNNVFDVSGVTNPIYQAISHEHGATDRGSLVESNVHVYNNTLYTNSATDTLRLCDGSVGSGHVCSNNLVYAPNARTREIASGNWTAVGNLADGATGPGRYTGNPFAAAVPPRPSSTLTSFQLRGTVTGGTNPVNASLSAGAAGVGFAFLDVFGACRPLLGVSAADVGAHELGSTSCGGPPTALLSPPMLLAPF